MSDAATKLTDPARKQHVYVARRPFRTLDGDYHPIFRIGIVFLEQFNHILGSHGT